MIYSAAGPVIGSPNEKMSLNAVTEEGIPPQIFSQSSMFISMSREEQRVLPDRMQNEASKSRPELVSAKPQQYPTQH